LNSHAVGSTVKSLRLPMFETMPVMIPTLIEQTKIANFLSAIDEKINHVQRQIEKTESWKKGLLQKMFV
jgi:type I restriction enzyme S subunit